MTRYKNLLFDLDGTLTDPVEGITKSVAYALEHLDIHVDDLTRLHPFIGPPLSDSFKENFHLTEEQIGRALIKYRERYVRKGIYENVPYTGIKDFLQRAGKKGYNLYVATSKPMPFARQILEHFELAGEFVFVGGSGLDGSRSKKADVIRYVLHEGKITDLSATVMIGDRKHDVIGAKETGLDSIGVLYGYGDYEELNTAGADYIVKDLTGLSHLLEI